MQGRDIDHDGSGMYFTTRRECGALHKARAIFLITNNGGYCPSSGSRESFHGNEELIRMDLYDLSVDMSPLAQSMSMPVIRRHGHQVRRGRGLSFEEGRWAVRHQVVIEKTV